MIGATRRAWRRLVLRVRLELLRLHYASIQCACESAALDPSPESGEQLVLLICRGIEVRDRIHELRAALR